MLLNVRLPFYMRILQKLVSAGQNGGVLESHSGRNFFRTCELELNRNSSLFRMGITSYSCRLNSDENSIYILEVSKEEQRLEKYRPENIICFDKFRQKC